MNPKISFVITARNDDYGGNLLNRIETFIKVLSHFTKKYKMRSELVVVEYNPLPNKQLLSAVLQLPVNSFLAYRFINVPKSFHAKQEGSGPTPVLEFVAKNIGIRRAYGDFILSMNPDIILSEEFMSWLATAEMDQNTYYRANRHDIAINYFNPNLTVEKIIQLSRRNVFRVWMNNKTQYNSWLAWGKRFLLGRSKKSFLMCPIFNKKADGTDQNIIHERAAGDFLLMHKTLWQKVRGYDSEPITGFLDGYILYMLYCLDAKQSILTYPIYHIDHNLGYAGRPTITSERYQSDVKKNVHN